MNDIVSFYLNETPDQSGRYLDDILAMPNHLLEKDHMFIQWLFPNKEPSHINPHAPLLTDDVIEIFRSRPDLKVAVKRSLDRMIEFYEMDEENPWWVTKNNHNYLRCTRILHCLRDFGMGEELSDFYVKLRTIYGHNSDVINSITESYWADAFEGQQEYLIVVTVKAEVTATRSVDVRASSLEEAMQIATEEVEENVNFVGSRDYQMSDEEMVITSIVAEEE